MSGDDHIKPPPVVWAQRPSVILLTICLEDCTDPDIKIYSDKVYFKGIGGTDRKTHEVTINLYKEIDPEVSLHYVRGRNIEFVLLKKEVGPFWPHLTKEEVKYHWLKFDFDKFKDEYDSEDEENDLDENVGGGGAFESLIRKMGGLGAGDNKPNLDDLEGENAGSDESDSDDADLPDLE